jgi:hypothetical protein
MFCTQKGYLILKHELRANATYQYPERRYNNKNILIQVPACLKSSLSIQ